jgi:hypothetical protein
LDYIKKHIKRCSRNLLFANLIFSAVIAIIAFLIITDIYNILCGPFKLNKELLTDHKNTLQRRYVESVIDNDGYMVKNYRYFIGNKYYFKIKDKNFFHTGVERILTDRFKQDRKLCTVGEFLMTNIDDKYLIIKVKESDFKESYKGFIVDFRDYRAIDILSKSDLQIESSKVLPFIFDATVGISYYTYAKTFILLALLGLNLFNYYKFFRRFMNFKKHPIYLWLCRYGEPDEIAAGMQKEIENVVGYGKKVIVTNMWTFRKKLFTLQIERNPVQKVQEAGGMQYIRRRDVSDTTQM